MAKTRDGGSSSPFPFSIHSSVLSSLCVCLCSSPTLSYSSILLPALGVGRGKEELPWESPVAVGHWGGEELS